MSCFIFRGVVFPVLKAFLLILASFHYDYKACKGLLLFETLFFHWELPGNNRKSQINKKPKKDCFEILLTGTCKIWNSCSILVDMDECQLADACGSYLVCKNTYGSYRCECSPGFTLDPSSWSDINPLCNGEKLKAILLILYMPY